jgi:hypothetical protein
MFTIPNDIDTNVGEVTTSGADPIAIALYVGTSSSS